MTNVPPINKLPPMLLLEVGGTTFTVEQAFEDGRNGSACRIFASHPKSKLKRPLILHAFRVENLPIVVGSVMYSLIKIPLSLPICTLKANLI